MAATPDRIRNVAILGLAALAMGSAGYIGARRTAASSELKIEPLAIENPDKLAVEDKLLVQIVGEVVKPGVYEFEEPVRVLEALKKAGGATENADLSKINLVQKIKDGMRIEVKSRPNPRFVRSSGPKAVIREPARLRGRLRSPSTKKPVVMHSSPIKVLQVDPTTAPVSELLKLPGATYEIVKNILDVRKRTKGFQKLSDLDQVPGIGPATLKRWEPYLVFD